MGNPIWCQPMNKLLTFLDNQILKFAVIFASLFVVLYPKLPSIYITHIWVYIRLEDFVIGAVVIIWLVQLLRKKVRFALPVGIPIIIYWLVGAASVIYSIVFIGPHLVNYFPKLVSLEYVRRIEYMILFFVGFSAIKSRKDLKDFMVFLFLGVGVVIAYGFGQHFYPYFWKYLPQFLQKTNFCFPSYQTGNEEFAKGIPLCLPVGSRVTSTFGGHYDLAGYLIIVLPIILGVFIFAKKKLMKIFLAALFITGVIMLILTSSRSAFIAYLFAVVVPLFFLGKKKYILPVLLLSVICLGLFSESTIQRFAQTFRLTTVAVNTQGQVVGLAENSLSQKVQNQLKKDNKVIQATQVVQGVVPEGSSFITLPQQRVATTTAVVQQGISGNKAEKLQLANGGLQLSTVKGNFSVQKALVYDISVTTRLQGEWPHAISSFLQYPFLGQGYSTLTLAVDNDYLRLLGESGILGFVAFVCIFVILGIYLRQLVPVAEDPLVRIFVYGLAGGVIGLFVNATLFDIFEASKVAEPLWLFLGIGAGALALEKKKVNYLKDILAIVTSRISLGIYLFIITLVAFMGSIGNFFVGDDFVWLKWAATSSIQAVSGYFTNASGFFYRPLDKTLMLLFYSIFAFQPQGYHVVILFLYGLMGVGVFSLTNLLLKKKSLAFAAAALFLLLPLHGENVYWISSLSIDLSSVLLLFGVIQFIHFRQRKSWWGYRHYVAVVLLASFALLSYELALVMPLLLLAVDLFVMGAISWKKVWGYVPFILLDVLYFGMRIHAHAFGVGGDYSYSIPHFIPNVIGNSVGYVGLFILGEKSLPMYEALRLHAKAFSLPIIILVVVIMVGIFIYLRKMQWKRLLTTASFPLFAIVLSGIALLPYLGLGNIAQRYGYLASVGFVMLVVWLLEKAITQLGNRKAQMAGGALVTIGILVWCVISVKTVGQEWQQASTISYNTLAYLKIEYPTLPHNSTLVFINRPIQYQNAWVFPTGLSEGLWFVYRDDTLTVMDAPRVMQTSFTKAKNTYVFQFSSGGQVTKVQ